MYSGNIPQPRPVVMGHEFMGANINHLQVEDRVVVPFPISCGGCFFSKHDLPSGCSHSNP
ncbi:hypothetical protein [Chryseobacterium sp.]|uniref:hypothetical protein n=1 Tax=Chryseobacterium sp. TaxID=1871047 RepID=UPI003890FD5C